MPGGWARMVCQCPRAWVFHGFPIPAVSFCSFWVGSGRTVDLGFDPAPDVTKWQVKHSMCAAFGSQLQIFWRPRFCHGKGLQGLKGLKAQAALRCPLAGGGCDLGWQMATGSRDLAALSTADAVHVSFPRASVSRFSHRTDASSKSFCSRAPRLE